MSNAHLGGTAVHTSKMLALISGITLGLMQTGHALNIVAVAAVPSAISSCDAALVEDTYQSTSDKYVDWRLAQSISQTTYNQLKQDLGANAVVYGVPLGASYQDFQQNISSFQSNLQESYTEQDFQNVAWTALDPQSSTNYANCLKALAVSSRKPLVLVPAGATATDITFNVIYTISGTSLPNPLRVKWTLGGVVDSALPATIPAGSTIITVKRPAAEQTLVVNSDAVGDADSIVLEPLPAPLPASAQYASICQILNTPDPVPTLAAYSSYTWPCPVMAAGPYQVTVSITPGSNIPARVGWQVDLVSFKGTVQTDIPLPLTSGTPIDINANANLAHVFQSIGTVSIPQGPIVFRLSINGVWNHCCFGPGGDRAGDVTIPKGVVLRLQKINAAN